MFLVGFSCYMINNFYAFRLSFCGSTHARNNAIDATLQRPSVTPIDDDGGTDQALEKLLLPMTMALADSANKSSTIAIPEPPKSGACDEEKKSSIDDNSEFATMATDLDGKDSDSDDDSFHIPLELGESSSGDTSD